jgi:hypothetical protein
MYGIGEPEAKQSIRMEFPKITSLSLGSIVQTGGAIDYLISKKKV